MDEVPKELNAKAYIMTIKEEEALNQWLDKQLKVGLIVESKSRYTVPYFYISKKDRSLCLVQDYQKLNQVTIKDKTLLLLIGEIINKLKEAKYFNKLDLIQGYNNIWVKEGDEWKAVCVSRSYHLVWVWQIAIFVQKACAVGSSCDPYTQSVKIVEGGLCSFLFSLFYFSFFFFFIFYFYFQNNSGQGLSVTLSHQSQLDGIVTRHDHGTQENEVEGTRTK